MQQSTEQAPVPYEQHNERIANRLFIGAEEATGTNDEIEKIKDNGRG